MLIRILKITEIDGVEYRANDVVDLDDKVGAAIVKTGAAASNSEDVAAGRKEGEPVSHKAVQNAGSVEAHRRELREKAEKA